MSSATGGQNLDLVTWLHEMTAEAVRTVEASEAASAEVDRHRNTVQQAYGLADLQV